MTVTYVAGPRGVDPGGCLRFKLPGFKIDEFRGEPPAYCSDPAVILRCSNTASVVSGKSGSEFFTENYLFVTIEGQAIKEGETVTVRYGEAAFPNIAAPQFSCPWAVEVATDLDGSRSAPGSGFYLVKDAPVIRFVADKAAKIEITIPSNTIVGEPFQAVVRVRDRYNNITPDYSGTVQLTARLGGSPSLARHEFAANDRGVHLFENVVFDSAGVNRLAAVDEAYGLFARSNPSMTTKEAVAYQLYWGDTHAHSSISADSAAANPLVPPRPQGVYDHARWKADLDFCTVTDHSEDISYRDWEETHQASHESYEPGKFVTFSAFEATHQPHRRSGDRNVYFLSDDADYVNKGTTEDLYRDLKSGCGGVMVIPHQHARTNWELHDPELERVVEVYSHWGCGLSPESEPPMIPGTRLQPEHYVSHALENGIRIGFIASGDHSGGRPGDDLWWGLWGLSNYTGGLAAVYAPALTREGIWGGLWQRRCYGTTRARILLEFEIDGHAMGEEYAIEKDTPPERLLTVKAYGTVPVAMVEIIKNGRELVSRPGHGALDVEFAHHDPEAERETDYYYVHVLQEDGEQAWSSPIWVIAQADTN
jgi:hypothetical protein